MVFTKVAVIGAGGNLGKYFMKSLLGSTEPKFQITVLARPSSSYTSPAENVKVIKHDLMDHNAMVENLRGNEALILMQGTDKEFVTVSKAAIQAAISAGVKMVMPSDYGSKDTPLFVKATAAKTHVRDFVQEKAQEGKITYTIVKNGAFIDFPLKVMYGIDPEAKKATLLDDGNQKFHTTSYASIANAVVGILRSPAQYANKTVHIHDFYTTQREILSIVESEVNQDGSKFETTSVDTEELGKKSAEALDRGEYNMPNIYGTIKSAVWGKEGAADWDENDDSQALGLGGKDLRAEIRRKVQTGL